MCKRFATPTLRPCRRGWLSSRRALPVSPPGDDRRPRTSNRRWRYPPSTVGRSTSARVRLAYGEQLRRTRAAADARIHLTAHSRRSTDWARRRGRTGPGVELRATGVHRNVRQSGDSPPLTAQQLQIAQLAASGLTNKQIAERLYLSPRTVSGHLYQIFPKLGVTTRAAREDSTVGELVLEGRTGEAASANGIRLWAGRIADSFLHRPVAAGARQRRGD